MGCLTHTSEHYKPWDGWETVLFKEARKDLFPPDLVNDFDKYQKDLIHLVGISERFSKRECCPNALFLRFEQKYWDYILDYGGIAEYQVSPRGEGPFIYKFSYGQPISNKQQQEIKVSIENKDLVLAYGFLVGVEDGVPVLSGRWIRAIPRHLYSTEVLSYVVKRDKNNKVITTESGLPEIEYTGQ